MTHEMNHEMNHFSMGLWVLVLAYAVSVIGSLVGLMSAQRAMAATDRATRLRWGICAALSIGGVAIWSMHFIGMMGFDVPGSTVRYNVPQTLLSAILAVGATAFGLAVVVFADDRGRGGLRLLLAGIVMGAAVSAMHYTGMWAIRIQGSISHETIHVIASIAIGIVASSAALWFSRVASRWYLQVPAALVMGFAVVALHYTGMAGVRVHLDAAAPQPAGISVTTLLFTGFGLGMIVLAVVVVSLLASGTQADREAERRIAELQSVSV